MPKYFNFFMRYSQVLNLLFLILFILLACAGAYFSSYTPQKVELEETSNRHWGISAVKEKL